MNVLKSMLFLVWATAVLLWISGQSIVENVTSVGTLRRISESEIGHGLRTVAVLRTSARPMRPELIVSTIMILLWLWTVVVITSVSRGSEELTVIRARLVKSLSIRYRLVRHMVLLIITCVLH